MIQTVILVNTEDFWGKLCDPRSVRTSRLSCAVGETAYVTLEAPEDSTGFLERIEERVLVYLPTRVWRP